MVDKEKLGWYHVFKLIRYIKNNFIGRGAFLMSKYLDAFRRKRKIPKGKNAEGKIIPDLIFSGHIVNNYMTVIKLMESYLKNYFIRYLDGISLGVDYMVDFFDASGQYGKTSKGQKPINRETHIMILKE